METKRKENETLHRGPGTFAIEAIRSLARVGTEEVAAGQLPATAVAGGEGGEGGQHEEGERNLGTLSVGLRVAGAGAPAAHRERRRRLQRAAALRWLGGVVEGSGSFTAARRS